MHALLRSLSGGDRRSIGESNRVAQRVLEQPELISVLFQGLDSADPVLRMRCADAIEKASTRRPDLLSPYRNEILHRFSKIGQQEVRWHVVPMLARLTLSATEETAVIDLLLGFTNERSSIVKALSMQALADIALRSAQRLPEIARHIEELSVIGTPAMKARGRKLLPLLTKAHRG